VLLWLLLDECVELLLRLRLLVSCRCLWPGRLVVGGGLGVGLRGGVVLWVAMRRRRAAAAAVAVPCKARREQCQQGVSKLVAGCQHDTPLSSTA
jgi:hypothetical protein